MPALSVRTAGRSQLIAPALRCRYRSRSLRAAQDRIPEFA